MKNRVVESILLVAFVLVLGFILAGCSNTESSPVEVTVVVPVATRPIPPEYGLEAELRDEERRAQVDGSVYSCQNMACDVLGEFVVGDIILTTGVIFGVDEFNQSARWWIVDVDGVVGYVPIDQLAGEPGAQG